MHNRKVAVIDNDKKHLGDIGTILMLGGYTPILVEDPLLAVDSVIHHEPDAILMDLKILRKGRCQVANVINRVFETSKVPIIAMSEFIQDDFRDLLNFFRIKSYLKKPFQPLDVIWLIENAIEMKLEGNRFTEDATPMIALSENNT